MVKKKVLSCFVLFFLLIVIIPFGFVSAGDTICPDDGGSDPVPTCADTANYCTTSEDCVASGYKWAGLSINQEGACTDPNNNCCIPYGTIGCGTTLSQSIALTDDVVCSGQVNGIVIGANNIKINCQGNSIGGTISGAGINLNGKSNVVVQNCRISPSTGTSKGLSVYSSSNIILEDLSLDVASYLIHFHTTTNSIVDRVRAVSCTGTPPIKIAFLLEGSSGNTIKNSDMNYCTRGLAITDGSDNNIIKSNNFNTQSGGFSLYLYNSGLSTNWAKNNIIYNNQIRGSYQVIPGNDYNTTYNCSAGPNFVGGGCIGGNYWSNYVPSDSDKDGIGDTSFTASSGVVDYLPLVPCANECLTLSRKECVLDSGTSAYKTCGDYDSDSCLEWSSVTNCPSGEMCINGECNQDPNAPVDAIQFKACCGGSGIPYSTAKVCAVPLPQFEGDCPNVIQYGSLKTLGWVFTEEVENSKPIILCDPGTVNNRKNLICSYSDIQFCENIFAELYPSFGGCQIFGYYISKQTSKPSSTIDYRLCSSSPVSYIANPWNPPGTYCTYNQAYNNLEGYLFSTEQSANDYGARSIYYVPQFLEENDCYKYAQNKSSCILPPGNNCTWTPPGTTNVSDGGGCCGYRGVFTTEGCTYETSGDFCTNVFDPANPKLTISGLDSENDRYCAKITSGLSYGFWYPTEFY